MRNLESQICQSSSRSTRERGSESFSSKSKYPGRETARGLGSQLKKEKKNESQEVCVVSGNLPAAAACHLTPPNKG